MGIRNYNFIGLYYLAFRKNGSPRWYVQKILFKKDRRLRKIFHIIVIKKRGSIRKIFRKWILDIPDISSKNIIRNKVAESSFGILYSLSNTLESNRVIRNESDFYLLSSEDLVSRLLNLSPRFVVSVFHDN